MDKRNTNNTEENSCEYKLREVTNEGIESILQHRNHFKHQAVNAAIKEALKRGIIKSIEDMESEEYQPRKIAPCSFLPFGTTSSYAFAIFKSLCRIFYGIALLSLIYNFRTINDSLKYTAIRR